jgi:hypothetical protein
LNVQAGGRQYRNETDGLGTCTPPSSARCSRPVAAAHSRRLPGKVKIIAAILEQPVIAKILTHLGLQARAPLRAPARRSQLLATDQPTPSPFRRHGAHGRGDRLRLCFSGRRQRSQIVRTNTRPGALMRMFGPVICARPATVAHKDNNQSLD